jgi:pyrroloquinoline quinone biosynthesis protein B
MIGFALSTATLVPRKAMVVQVLGSAAGGGVPQWNCGCRQCEGARAGLLESRTQCSFAITIDERRWVLVNASPDLRPQLAKFRSQPAPRTRSTPINTILLTDADLDHTLGLFLLRENPTPISIQSSEGIRRIVEEGLRVNEILDSYCGIQWQTVPCSFKPFVLNDGSQSGLEYKAVPVEGPCPRYWKGVPYSSRVAYVLRELATGKSVLFAPAVARLEPQLLAELGRADAIFFDGTFWADDDFEKSGLPISPAGDLLRSHLPISSGSLETIAAQRARHKIYVHINNTNPILWPTGPERKAVEARGIQVAADGMTFLL